MAVGIGIPAVDDGSGGLIGRSPLDDRLLVRADYHNLGIIMGAAVGTSSSGMSYTVGNGSDPVSVAIGARSGADGATKFVVPTGSVGTTAAPSSGGRIDRVWARQLDPDKGDESNQSVLGVSQGAASANPMEPSIPAGAVELAVFLIPQGATRTSQATLVRVGDYAIPYGASLGVLHQFRDTLSAQIPASWTQRGAAEIHLPTSRLLEFSLSATANILAPDNDGNGHYEILLNGQVLATYVIQFGRHWGTEYVKWTQEVPAGTHTVAYRERSTSIARPHKRASDYFTGTVFRVKDEGVV